MRALKPCPFCGGDGDAENDLGVLESGEIDNAAAWWDSGLRGEYCGYVACLDCGAIIKGEDEDDAVRKWNTRAMEVEEDGEA